MQGPGIECGLSIGFDAFLLSFSTNRMLLFTASLCLCPPGKNSGISNICVHHHTLRGPCPKAQGNLSRIRSFSDVEPYPGDAASCGRFCPGPFRVHHKRLQLLRLSPDPQCGYGATLCEAPFGRSFASRHTL